VGGLHERTALPRRTPGSGSPGGAGSVGGPASTGKSSAVTSPAAPDPPPQPVKMARRNARGRNARRRLSFHWMMHGLQIRRSIDVFSDGTNGCPWRRQPFRTRGRPCTHRCYSWRHTTPPEAGFLRQKTCITHSTFRMSMIYYCKSFSQELLRTLVCKVCRRFFWVAQRRAGNLPSYSKESVAKRETRIGVKGFDAYRVQATVKA
jgi:hypothetical protein